MRSRPDSPGRTILRAEDLERWIRYFRSEEGRALIQRQEPGRKETLVTGLAVLSDGTTVEANLVIIAHGAYPHIPRGVGGEAGIPVDDHLRVRGRSGILAAGAVALFTG